MLEWLWNENSSAVRLPWSQALLQLDRSAHAWFRVPTGAGETGSSVESAPPKPGGSWFVWAEVPIQVSDCSILMQMRTLNPHSMIAPKALSWLVRTEPLWLVGFPNGWGKPQSHWSKLQEHLYTASLREQRHSVGRHSSTEAGRSARRQAVQHRGTFIRSSLHERTCVQTASRHCTFLSAVSHQEPFLSRCLSFLSGFTKT